MISLVPSESWGSLSGCGLLPENGVRGFAPPGAFGRAAASPQTRQMRCWLSAAQAAYHSFPSLPPTKTRSLRCTAFFPPKPLRWVSAGALLGEVIKLSFCIFSAFLCGGGITTLGPLWLCRNNPARGLFQQKKRLSQSGCSVPTDALFPPAHSAFSALLCGGWYHYPRRALHAVETLDVQELRRRIRRFYAAAVLALCGLNLPSSGTHATPAPNRAHSGSQGETRRVLRVDGDDVFGSGIIDPIDPFQADQTVAVALAEGHRNAVSP